MLRLMVLVLGVLVRALGSRRDLVLENLRQQLATYKCRNRRSRIGAADRAFLGHAPSDLGPVVRCARGRKTGHRRAVAPCWVPSLLIVAVAPTSQ
jgi:hypothetical protein